MDKFNRQQTDDIFLFFPRTTGFDSSCKLSPLETICMKCQNPISGKNKKKYFNMLSAGNFTHSAKCYDRFFNIGTS